jgi:large conductance mechanosensitive channel
MKKFIGEFKEFISRGSVMDLAVGMIIGSAFTAIVTSLVNNIFMPLISMITGGISFTQWNIPLAAGEEPPTLGLGDFAGAVLNFIIVAICIFLVVKALNKFRNLAVKKKEDEEAAAPTTKVCPFCKSEIAIDATRCPHCTSVLEEAAAE